MSEVNPQETVPEVPHVSTPEGESDDTSQIKLEQLNELLGRDYKDVDTALNAVKETYSFVGKRDELRQGLEDVMKATGADESKILESLQSLMSQSEETKTQEPKGAEFDPDALRAELNAQYQEDRFFDKNPEFEAIKDYVKPLKQQEGFKNMSWDEFAQTDQAKKLVETFSGFEQANNKKSVVESNPRLGAISDKMSKAREALSQDDLTAAKSNAIGAVIDSFDAE